ncbi:hypothetical protein L249_4069 [Ophiocordyceps polyrhachis-furcata BCC 54312]|uniref:Ribosomal RNA-processing protein 8 n=1 Tax=Ophiocordyceps polyrhachis-furcata BCC 54312 TaxID=1330021 RepID=A0A367L540_9HYPO|nr:hypothetical protein L249_4069 [Ophiocordyceps polyrhachis-furcata BCC 54312]
MIGASKPAFSAATAAAADDDDDDDDDKSKDKGQRQPHSALIIFPVQSIGPEQDMFAVPGWSVSVGSLKAEESQAGDAARGKKRKRASEAVTAANVVDLYETVVEGRKEKSLEKKGKKKKKKEKSQKRQADDHDNHDVEADTTQRTTTPQKEKAGKPDEKRDAKGRRPRSEVDDDGVAEKKKENMGIQVKGSRPVDDNAGSKADPRPEPPKPAKLTPLQASMKEKLVSARFRHLNETLYTRPSDEAFRLFKESPDMFDDYHQGFRRQVKVWPENPVDSFLQDIRKRASSKSSAMAKARSGNPPPPKRSDAEDPLPRTVGTCTIADLGCGDARLAASLEAENSEKLRLKVLSYDFYDASPLVTRADIAHLPLEDGSVNVAIFCLALMGTNWIDFIEEAYRILHWKGELWVAEIKSRFGPVRGAHAGPVHHSVGSRKKPAAAKKPARATDQDASDAEDLVVEVDGADDRRRQTDVSAFVEVLRRRGFVLRASPGQAIDLSNRMFVKLYFVKAAAPTRGKAAKAQGQATATTTTNTATITKETKGAVAKKWLGNGQGDDAKEDADEAAILKPCVYKLR